MGRPALHLAAGTAIGRYRLRRWLGSGLSGDVYEALQPATGRAVALKLARPRGRTGPAIDPIRREAELLAGLCHPAIVPLIDAGTWRGRAFLVLALARGGSLAGRVGLPWPPAAALRVLAPLAGALAKVHALGVVHRDVSSGNVLLDGAGNPWLTDFSVALLPGETWATGREAAVAGTPGYIAPEILRGARPSPASDLYSLAALAYLLLCGVLPTAGAAEPAAMPPVPIAPRAPSSINALLPEAIDAVVLRALSEEPADRYPSPGAFIDTLMAAAERAVSAQPGGDRIPAADPPQAADGAARAGDQLEAFARTLPAAEQAALLALLRDAETRVARAAIELQDLSMGAFGPAAALLAFEDSGTAGLLAAGPRTVAELADAGVGQEAVLRLLLNYLAHRGLVVLSGGRYALPPGPALLYAPARGRQRPLRAAWTFWSHLPARAAGAGPATTMDTPEGDVYADTVGVLAAAASEAAEQVATLLDIVGNRRSPRVLDMGAGSGVWSLALARRDPALRVTAVDRPLVLDVTRRYAREAGVLDRLTCVSGDMHTVDLPDAAFDLAIVANVLHLESGERIVPLLTRLRAALASGGHLAVIDIVPASAGAADEREHLMRLHLALRTPAGTLHTAEDYDAWLRAARFQPRWSRPLTAGDARYTLILAARA